METTSSSIGLLQKGAGQTLLESEVDRLKREIAYFCSKPENQRLWQKNMAELYQWPLSPCCKLEIHLIDPIGCFCDASEHGKCSSCGKVQPIEN